MGYGLHAEACGGLVGQATQVADGDVGGDARHGVDDTFIDGRILLEARARGQQGGKGVRGRQAADGVGRRLLQADKGTDGHRLVQVAGRLAAPGRAIDGGFARLGVEGHHRVVVVQQAAPLDVLQPEAGVRALARAALAQEKIATPFVADDGGVHHQRSPLGSGEGVDHHQEVVHHKRSHRAQGLGQADDVAAETVGAVGISLDGEIVQRGDADAVVPVCPAAKAAADVLPFEGDGLRKGVFDVGGSSNFTRADVHLDDFRGFLSLLHGKGERSERRQQSGSLQWFDAADAENVRPDAVVVVCLVHLLDV